MTLHEYTLQKNFALLSSGLALRKVFEFTKKRLKICIAEADYGSKASKDAGKHLV
jgi:hypothetical protein